MADLSADARPDILLLFDKFSDYKQILFNSIAQNLGGNAKLTILVHNQSVDLLEYFLDTYLGQFDYYVLTPHFPLDEKSQARALKQISRIPNRKLLLLDHLQPGLSGNFSAVYQDFENDIFDGLMQGLPTLKRVPMMRVITLPQSLYGPFVQKGVKRFTDTFSIPVEFMTTIPDEIHKGETFLLLNSQWDTALVQLSQKILTSGLRLGEDVHIISYNDVDLNELVLGGLTTVSTDFREMGRLAAEIILSRQPKKIHCPFRMNRRNTF